MGWSRLLLTSRTPAPSGEFSIASQCCRASFFKLPQGNRRKRNVAMLVLAQGYERRDGVTATVPGPLDVIRLRRVGWCCAQPDRAAIRERMDKEVLTGNRVVVDARWRAGD